MFARAIGVSVCCCLVRWIFISCEGVAFLYYVMIDWDDDKKMMTLCTLMMGCVSACDVSLMWWSSVCRVGRCRSSDKNYHNSNV